MGPEVDVGNILTHLVGPPKLVGFDYVIFLDDNNFVVRSVGPGNKASLRHSAGSRGDILLL
jgi:hypothetical protein